MKKEETSLAAFDCFLHKNFYNYYFRLQLTNKTINKISKPFNFKFSEKEIKLVFCVRNLNLNV